MRQSQELVLDILKAAKAKGDIDRALRASKEIRENAECMRRLLTKTPEQEKPKAKKREVRIEYQ